MFFVSFETLIGERSEEDFWTRISLYKPFQKERPFSQKEFFSLICDASNLYWRRNSESSFVQCSDFFVLEMYANLGILARCRVCLFKQPFIKY